MTGRVRSWIKVRFITGFFVTVPIVVTAYVLWLFYSWVEVSTWCRERMRLPLTRPDPGLVAADLAIRLRLLAPRVRRMELLDDLLS